MGAGDEVARTILSVASKSAVISMQAILRAMTQAKNSKALEAQKAEYTGEQTLQALSSHRIPLDSIPVSNADIFAMSEKLREYGIDFTVLRNDVRNEYTLYFKGTDTTAIQNALQEIVDASNLINKDRDVDRDKTSDLTEEKTEPLDQQIKEAQEKSAEINAERSSQKSADKSKDHKKIKEHTR